MDCPKNLRGSTWLLIMPAMLAIVLVRAFSPSTTAAEVGLEKRLRNLIEASGAEAVAVALHDAATGRELLVDADSQFHAASTMKVPVMMEVFREAHEGALSLDDRIAIKNSFSSIVDGSAYSLSPDDDSDTSLYSRIGQTATIRELLRLMITVSSNLATNLLIERTTAARVMVLMQGIGAKRIRVLRGVEDNKAYERGLNNTTTARDLMIILRSIAEHRAVSPSASDEMIELLLDQSFNEGIPSQLPTGVKVAHKTGSITKTYHDAGIVFPPDSKPYILVVLTRGLADESRAHKLVSEISKTVYQTITAKH